MEVVFSLLPGPSTFHRLLLSLHLQGRAGNDSPVIFGRILVSPSSCSAVLQEVLVLGAIVHRTPPCPPIARRGLVLESCQ